MSVRTSVHVLVILFASINLFFLVLPCIVPMVCLSRNGNGSSCLRRASPRRCVTVGRRTRHRRPERVVARHKPDALRHLHPPVHSARYLSLSRPLFIPPTTFPSPCSSSIGSGTFSPSSVSCARSPRRSLILKPPAIKVSCTRTPKFCFWVLTMPERQ